MSLPSTSSSAIIQQQQEQQPKDQFVARPLHNSSQYLFDYGSTHTDFMLFLSAYQNPGQNSVTQQIVNKPPPVYKTQVFWGSVPFLDNIQVTRYYDETELMSSLLLHQKDEHRQENDPRLEG